MNKRMMVGPDLEKIKRNLDSLIGELRAFLPPGHDPHDALVAGLIGTLCQTYDVQKIYDVVKAIANDPQFWKQQQDSKAGRIVLT